MPKKRINPGISCEVSSCHFYMEGDCCCADKIKVAKRDEEIEPTESKQTDCETFRS